MSTRFEPSARRAMECRRAMDAALLASIDVLLADDRPTGPASQASGTAAASEVKALDYGAYFDLALVALGVASSPELIADATCYLRQRLPAIQAVDAGPLPPGKSPARRPLITTLSSQFYPATAIDRFKRWWDLEGNLSLTAVTGPELMAARDNIALALDLLEQCAPELHDEILTIVREVVIAKPVGSRPVSFGGASSFALWGAAVINALEPGQWHLHYQLLVHEAAHNLLFALARDEPLVLNDIEERAYSHLRMEPRPIDGIYHAAFVSARECLALDRLLCWHEDTGRLSAGDAEGVAALLNQAVIAFWECTETLRTTAQLSSLGEPILRECEDFMRANFALAAA